MTISHNTREKRFEGTLEGKNFFVEYDFSLDGEIIITHTYVHSDLRGQGIAAALLEHLSAWAKEEQRKIVPICSYAVAFYKRHKEYQHLLKDEETLSTGGYCTISRKKHSP
ncbi:MAG: GNAT family N-acetyltransferase [Brevinematales bacterium]